MKVAIRHHTIRALILALSAAACAASVADPSGVLGAPDAGLPPPNHANSDASGIPDAIQAMPASVRIAAGDAHTCALTSGGRLKCWGHNGDGQLGSNSTVSSLVPVDVNGLPSGITAVTAGDAHTCVLTSGGGVKCWGDNGYGQLGNNSTVNSPVPVDVNGLPSGVVAVTAGDVHTCAVTAGGGLKCWGRNVNGELGNNSNVNSLVPVDVNGLPSGATALAAGTAHTCVLTSSGSVKCFGDNGSGQLGNNSKVTSLVTIDVNGLSSGVTALAAGSAHTCALGSSGRVKCWGRGAFGELGNNGTEGSLVPVDAIGLTSGVIAVTAGDYHTCALTFGGGVKCWGDNGEGQLGDNSKVKSLVSVDVNSLTSGVTSVAAGYKHTCAFTSGGSLKCWGSNNYGQLGNNTKVKGLVPADVVGFP